MVSGQKTGHLSHKSGRVTMQKHITNSLKQKPSQRELTIISITIQIHQINNTNSRKSYDFYGCKTTPSPEGT